MSYDLLVVGSGLTGATIARLAKDAGYVPLIVERRSVLGGNIRDEIHEPTGLRYNLYGPHYFRTNSEKIWAFVNRFSSWRPWSAEVMTLIDGKLEHWPPNREFVDRYDPWWKPKDSDPIDFEFAALNKMPVGVYLNMVKPYTEKQWGLTVQKLLPSLASRFSIREDSSDHRLTTHKYQVLPINGYSWFAEHMLDGIDITQQDFRFSQRLYMPVSLIDKPIVFTGPIDELFEFKFGKLPYRAQKREHLTVEYPGPCVQVNYPGDYYHIRQIFWQHTVPNYSDVLNLETTETPYTPTDFDSCEYPVPTQAAQNRYRSYYQLAKQYPRLILAGRLAEYRYLDMDQAIGRAMSTWEKKVKPLLEASR